MGERKRSYDSEWIHRLERIEHWNSYWYQLKLMEGQVRAGDSLVELGTGSGFLANYLRSKGVLVTTVDIDEAKSPNIVVDGVDYHPDVPFDHFCAFEVFEHMEFSEMGTVLDNIAEYVRGNVFMSLPVFAVVRYLFDVKIFGFRKALPVKMRKSRIQEKNHRWELGFQGLDEGRVTREFAARGFLLQGNLQYLHWRYFHYRKGGQ